MYLHVYISGLAPPANDLHKLRGTIFGPSRKTKQQIPAWGELVDALVIHTWASRPQPQAEKEGRGRDVSVRSFLLYPLFRQACFLASSLFQSRLLLASTSMAL